jgi:hypothetical protein
MVYAASAVAVAVVPSNWLVPVVLILWAIVTIPSTIGMVAFNVVMDGAAGPRGRMDLLSRRWSIMGLTTAVTVAIAGQVLDRIGFALNYQIVFIVFSAAGLLSSWFSWQIKMPDHAPRVSEPGLSARQRLRSYLATIAAQRPFVWFVARQTVIMFGIRFATPLIPLYYVREAHAPDSWIGIIGTVQSLTLLVGYYSWRRLARRFSTRRLLTVVTIGTALYPALLVLSHDLIAITVITAYGAFIGSGFDLVLFDELMKTIPQKAAVTFSAFQTSVANLAAIIAPLVGAASRTCSGLVSGSSSPRRSRSAAHCCSSWRPSRRSSWPALPLPRRKDERGPEPPTAAGRADRGHRIPSPLRTGRVVGSCRGVGRVGHADPAPRVRLAQTPLDRPPADGLHGRHGPGAPQ